MSSVSSSSDLSNLRVSWFPQTCNWRQRWGWSYELLSNFTVSFMCYHLCPSQECKLHKGRDLSMCCSLIYPKQLEEGLQEELFYKYLLNDWIECTVLADFCPMFNCIIKWDRILRYWHITSSSFPFEFYFKIEKCKMDKRLLWIFLENVGSYKGGFWIFQYLQKLDKNSGLERRLNALQVTFV